MNILSLLLYNGSQQQTTVGNQQIQVVVDRAPGHGASDKPPCCQDAINLRVTVIKSSSSSTTTTTTKRMQQRPRNNVSFAVVVRSNHHQTNHKQDLAPVTPSRYRHYHRNHPLCRWDSLAAAAAAATKKHPRCAAAATVTPQHASQYHHDPSALVPPYSLTHLTAAITTASMSMTTTMATATTTKAIATTASTTTVATTRPMKLPQRCHSLLEEPLERSALPSVSTPKKHSPSTAELIQQALLDLDLSESSLQNDGDDDDDNSTGSIELDENQDGPCAQHRIDSQSSFSPSSSLSLAQNSSWNSAASSENSFATSTPLAYEPFSILRQATNASKDNDSKNDDLTGR